MLKKLDKLIIRAFLGPFILTFVVVVFILLTQYLLKYVDDFVGKNLGFTVFAELIFYFSLNMVPLALPLGILLSSLMTFGNLGEHLELTAIKSSGISLLRVLLPISFFVIVFAVGSFFFNNLIVPKANLKAFSLLYDIRQKKPALDIREGVFYNGIPGYSIKVAKKYPDSKSLKNVIIYNHTNGNGNTDVIIADSGLMYTFNHEQYLALELFNGDSYTEYFSRNSNPLYPRQFIINEFSKSKLVFSLASFGLNRTPQELFSGNRLMKNIDMLNKDADSLSKEREKINKDLPSSLRSYHVYNILSDTTNNTDKLLQINLLSKRYINKDADSLSQEHEKINKNLPLSLYSYHHILAIPSDTISKPLKTNSLSKRYLRNDTFNIHERKVILNRAVSMARSIKDLTTTSLERMAYLSREAHVNEIEKFRKYTLAVTCFVMFLIGAPLGAIIRKGGLGFPVLISIVFFILYFVISNITEKWAKESIIPVWVGMWTANLILLPVGIFFLIQAKNDSRLLEFNFNFGFVKRIMNKLLKKRG